MAATSVTLSSKLNRATILVDGEGDHVMDVVTYLPPGDYDMRLLGSDSNGEVTWGTNSGEKIRSRVIKGWTDDGSSVYTLRVLVNRANKAKK